MAFKRKNKKIGSNVGKIGGAVIGGAVGTLVAGRRGNHTPQPKASGFTSNLSSAPRHLRTQYNPTVNTASNIVSNVGRSIINSNRSYSRGGFGDAMGDALGTAIGSAIVMGVSSKIQEKQQEYRDKKAAEALAAQQAAAAAEQAKKEAAFHAMNKNMPNYDEEAMVHLMNGAGLTEEEKANYPLKCPHCLGVPDGTRYCPYCGGKLV